MANVRVPVRRRIRPAGWVLIVGLLGGAAYAAYELGGDQLRPLLDKLTGKTPPARVAAPVHPTSPPPRKVATPTPPAAPPVAPAPVATASTPPLAAVPPAPKVKATLAVPPLLHAAGLRDAITATSELDAIRLVADGKASVAVTSVVALAAAPESQRKDLQLVRLLGFWPDEAALGSSCDPAKLRGAKLGAVRGSLAHFVLLRLTEGVKPPPDIALFDDEPSLATAYATGRITGELPLGLRGAVDVSTCKPLPDADYAFVAVQHVERPVAAEELTQLLGPLGDKITSAQVAAFVQPDPGSYLDVFATASRTWLAANVIVTTAPAPEILTTNVAAPFVAAAPDGGSRAGPSDGGTSPSTPDGGTLAATTTTDAGTPASAAFDGGVATSGHPGSQAKTAPTVPKPAAPQPTSRELGFPSWVDR